MRTTSASAVPSLVSADDAPSSMVSSPRTPSEADHDQPPLLNDKDNLGANEVEIKDEEPEAVDPEEAVRANRLKFLLDKSEIYAKVIGDRMERQQVEKARTEALALSRRANREKRTEAGPSRETRSGGKSDASPLKRRRRDERPSSKRVKLEVPQAKPEPREDDGEPKQYSFRQPDLVTGATLRDYQLAGVQWMISLYENGLNGILADEMGLGKTLQTISFFAHLRAKGTWGPFLIVCPLSVLHNWISEFEKFAPSIPVVMYHGTQDERAEIRATRLQPPPNSNVGNIRENVYRKGKKRPASAHYKFRRGTNTTDTYPIIVTTYEICINDQKHLSGLLFKFIVVDEGHRLKNLDCKLIRELKSYTSANRMILTGTPLHNNLAELWSLLNFILPDIFDDLDAFQQWFNLGDMGSEGLLDKTAIVTSLHAILKPFLLRRLKSEVERGLPPKKEYLLYAPLTQQQKDFYHAILTRNHRQYLINAIAGVNLDAEDVESLLDGETPSQETAGRATRDKAEINYRIEENDHKYIRNLEKAAGTKAVMAKPKGHSTKEQQALQINNAIKTVNNMRLQNLIMQLRKISSHPFLFYWPTDPETGEEIVDERLINASGKMLLLNRLLDALFAKGHKVLIFSQFTTMLDIIQDWATLYKGIKLCRIDGTTTQEERRSQMDEFNNGGDSPDACKLFILSTRAGGLGINLVAADTVIFFDQDWNPQMDLQAQDRAHRIGQTKPVLIFRLVSEHTVETKILQKAGDKRKLEALVIQQGKFGKVVDENGRVLLGRSSTRGQSTADMARALLDLDGEEINVADASDKIISDADLEVLLDRSPEAYARQKGWAAGLGKVGQKGREAQLAKGERTAFEVFETQRDEAAEGLAHMFEGDGEKEEQ
ncbi:uncharacterized protein CcaverHIS019_0302900 [Cutaneotrichosporon cavernicola]|uniref:Helicase n=1 Tax=Cutaneotrichosporon cavernicola TaxID=279322 RepID=A0AA48I9C5_9TREE|nr:uncharacterized protein CcaverHIS019_0302900 [Cutaneotrichosporon cavernicola]BEI90220.1 hypothetical protein CcaverHIS019_0302900 [Cutaneotrichosporon cavernicola]BEI97999.1 hypothetical protein CcaverHIS631_0302980 [Cutaneotrichosporon cavernicola]BEJ05775.1 hypothetical protein CcaverHIS641_0302970 [Cutaneotrichosporon cavernicola]